jgi:hypothetical protein
MGAGSNRTVAALLAGVSAGILSTVAQILLWVAFGEDALGLLLRDSRLTAALVLGHDVLPPPATFDIEVMLAATAIHFLLSILYAAVLLPVRRSGPVVSLMAGAGFGIALYFVNMHGFTAIFPWFAEARSGITLATHVVFGVTVSMTYQYLGALRRD